MTYNPSIGDGAQLMDIMQLQATLAGYHLLDPDGVTVEPGTDPLAVDVTFSTDARLGGPAETVDDVTDLSLPDPDTDDPRKVLVYVDDNGDVQAEGGLPAPPDPDGEERQQTVNPQVPIPSGSFLPLAEVWLEANASDISSGDISSLRVPFAMGEGSGMDADTATSASLVRDVEPFWLQSTSEFEQWVGDSANAQTLSASPISMGATASSPPAMETVANLSTAMDEIASSSTAMSAVASSITAMNEIASSQLALETVWDSDTAWEKIADSQMALGKFIAGSAGLDPRDYPDLDAVISSSSAMSDVGDSPLSLAGLLSSGNVISDIWQQDDPSMRLVEAFDPTPPHEYATDVESSIVSNQYSNGNALQVAEYERNTHEDETGTYTLDLTPVSTLRVVTDYTRDNSSQEMIITIDGSREFETSSNHEWTTQTIDVESFSGEVDVGFGIYVWGGSATQEAKFSEIELLR